MFKRSGWRAGGWRIIGLAVLVAATPDLRAQSSGRPAKARKAAANAKKKPAKPDAPPASSEGTQPSHDPDGLAMSPAVVCRRIDGYEDFKPLPGAALTADEKLLVYYRPLRYRTDTIAGDHTAHLVQDNEIRKKGKKQIVLQKRRVVEYQPKQAQPLGAIYMSNTISLKGLTPGEYELTIILRDELDRGSPPSKQVVRFKVIPAIDPRAKASSKKDEDPPEKDGS
jgi:hypothetical protein